MLSRSVEVIKKAMDERRSISAYYDNYFRKLSSYELGTKKENTNVFFTNMGEKVVAVSLMGKVSIIGDV